MGIRLELIKREKAESIQKKELPQPMWMILMINMNTSNKPLQDQDHIYRFQNQPNFERQR